jgi:hypothetical protein
MHSRRIIFVSQNLQYTMQGVVKKEKPCCHATPVAIMFIASEADYDSCLVTLVPIFEKDLLESEPSESCSTVSPRSKAANQPSLYCIIFWSSKNVDTTKFFSRPFACLWAY